MARWRVRRRSAWLSLIRLDSKSLRASSATLGTVRAHIALGAVGLACAPTVPVVPEPAPPQPAPIVEHEPAAEPVLAADRPEPQPGVEFCEERYPADALEVFCSDNGVDLGPLSGLPKLRHVKLTGFGATGVEALAGLPDLELLWIDTAEAGTAWLDGLPVKIMRLGFSGDEPPELSGLSGMDQLKELELSWLTEVPVDLEPVGNVASLRRLGVLECKDLRPLTRLPQLEALDLGWVDSLKDFGPLASMPALRALSLGGRSLRSVRWLKYAPLLVTLHLDHTFVRDLGPVAKLEHLTVLSIDNSSWTEEAPVRDLRPLARLTKLERLVLRHTKVEDLTPLAGIASLDSVDVRMSRDANVEDLLGVKSLRCVALDEDALSAETRGAFQRRGLLDDACVAVEPFRIATSPGLPSPPDFEG